VSYGIYLGMRASPRGNVLIKEEIHISSVIPRSPFSSSSPGLSKSPMAVSPHGVKHSPPIQDLDDIEGVKRWDLEIETRMSLDLNLFICLACSGSKYSSKDKLNVITHIKNKHVPNFAGFVCQVCSKIFNKNKNFEKHIREAHNIIPVHQSAEPREEESIVDFSSA